MKRLLVILSVFAVSFPACVPIVEQAASQPRVHCGVERWAVKTLTDQAAASVNLTPLRSSVAKLSALPVPAGLGQNAPRLAPELHAYQLTWTMLVKAKLEGDSDYHLVLENPAGQTMIAEIPLPACAAGSRVAAGITSARAAIDAAVGPIGSTWRTVGRRIIIQGVLFFDLPHGQTGVAPNAVELHPVMLLRFAP